MERAMMDAAKAARAIDGVLRGPNAWFSGVSTDSRSLAPGDLFVAIKGDKFDGHDFVSQAFDRGAAAAIVAVDRAPELGGAMQRPRRCSVSPTRSRRSARWRSSGGADSRFPLRESWAATARPLSRK